MTVCSRLDVSLPRADVPLLDLAPGQAGPSCRHSASNNYTWNATGLAGTYRIEVDWRNQGSTVAYTAWANILYSLDACNSAGLSASPSVARMPGTHRHVDRLRELSGIATYRF